MYEKYIIQLFIAGTLLIVVFAFFLIFFLAHMRSKQNVFYLEKQKLIFDNQNARIEEGERMMNQISKEVHDNIGQAASLVVMSLHMIERLAVSQDQQAIIERTLAIATQMVGDAQNISHSLNSDFIKARGLVEILREELEHIHLSKGVEYTLEHSGSIDGLKADMKLIIFRIAQEALHNTLKHAEASKINLTLSIRGNRLCVTIADNGIGFSPDRISHMPGIGLRNMYQRARALKSILEIRSEPGAGTSVVLTIPDISVAGDNKM